MPRPIQATYTRANSVTIAGIGDSLTHNPTTGVRPDQFWPARLALLLRETSVPARARNFGRSGNTTTQMLVRISRMTQFDIPRLAIIFGGVNDPGTGITGATTQSNIEAMGETLLDAGADYLVIGNTQYLNYTGGGDDISTPYATYATLRPFQAAAANALIAAYPGRVALCDIYGFMRQLIVDGVEDDNSASWHVDVDDQHLNPLGEQYVADAMFATIQAQSGWVAALSRR